MRIQTILPLLFVLVAVSYSQTIGTVVQNYIGENCDPAQMTSVSFTNGLTCGVAQSYQCKPNGAGRSVKGICSAGFDLGVIIPNKKALMIATTTNCDDDSKIATATFYPFIDSSNLKTSCDSGSYYETTLTGLVRWTNCDSTCTSGCQRNTLYQLPYCLGATKVTVVSSSTSASIAVLVLLLVTLALL